MIRARLDASRHAEAIARGSAALAGLLAGDDPDPGARTGSPRAGRPRRRGGSRPGAPRRPLRSPGGSPGGSRGGAGRRGVGGAAARRDRRPRRGGARRARGAALAAVQPRAALRRRPRRPGPASRAGVGRAGSAAQSRRGTRTATRRCGALLAAVAEHCAVLSSRRAAAAADLGTAVESAVAELGLRGARVAVAVGRRFAAPEEPAIELDGDAVAFDATGADAVVFQIAPNPGEPARPLAKIASGGELSRLALAIEEVLAAADATPTLVFDEIDAGIGGRSADPVGRTLWLLGRRHQVLCVTHLPQIAAHADAHFGIREDRAGRPNGHGRAPADRRGAGRRARCDDRRPGRRRRGGGIGAGPAGASSGLPPDAGGLGSRAAMSACRSQRRGRRRTGSSRGPVGRTAPTASPDAAGSPARPRGGDRGIPAPPAG